MMGTTGRQQEALDFIERYIAVYRKSPSIREIAAELGVVSSSRAQSILYSLKERGLVDWLPGKARSITITQSGQQFTLPSDLDTKLRRYCMAHGEVASAVVADAVALHLDQMEAQHNAPGECEHCGDGTPINNGERQ